MSRLFTLTALVALGCGRANFDSRTSDATPSMDGARDVGIDGKPKPLPAPGCVLRYEMDEASWTGGVVDSCGNHPGMAINGANAVDDPARGRVGKFVGGTSCVTTPDAQDLQVTTGLSISAWIKPTSVPPGNPDSYGVVSKRISIGQSSEYSVWINADPTLTKDQITVDIDTENDRAADPNADYLNRWRQITVVYDGTTDPVLRTSWYADGVLSYRHVETSAMIAPEVPEPDLWVGCLPLAGAAGQSMVGFMDEVVIWNRALTPTEVTAWYMATLK